MMRYLNQMLLKLKTRTDAFLYPALFKPLGSYDGSPFLSNAFSTANLPEFLQATFNIALAVGAIAAVVRITYGGFLYMTSDIADNKNKAKNIITMALVGLLLLFATYIILKQINPDILNLDLKLKS